ncbi:dipeptidase [Winogradskyella sp. UBA3174]|uniref:dipeptidase n=1 Tax=Winogradskyella sp. UBA3174 TaxID=1947785 RepID=UPI0025F98000|nr:dipeptidase [Winogradskyella sp. UBA3174]|tara:strand:+ start:2741 stop:3982 length:1242 start_codon:yes stop_codon:yes gene_type:complete
MSCKSEISKEDKLLADAKAIHERVITLDTHCDINVKNFTDELNYTQDLDTQITLPKMKEGGLDVAWFIVYTGQDSLTDSGYENAYKNAMSKFSAIHKLVEDIAPNDIELALTSDDVRRIDAKGKKVAMIGIENGYPVGLDISNVEKFYKRGARYMSLSHNGHSQLCDSNTGESDNIWLHNGLSDLGKQVVTEMNRVGMMIDVSHPSKESMRQMIALSKAPIIASHSSARALCNHSRNLDDEQLVWLKENGGVVQTVAFTSYLNTEKFEKRVGIEVEIAKQILDSMGVQWAERDAQKLMTADERNTYYGHLGTMVPIRKNKLATLKDLPPAVDVSDFVNHIDYLVEKMGIDHVGISSDFDGGGGIAGWSDASETFNVTLELVKRGYTEAQIEQLWSGNLLRVLDEVEAVAKTLN